MDSVSTSHSPKKTAVKLSGQAKQVLKHLRDVGSLTAYEAMKFYNISHITSPIFNLKKNGYAIETKEEEIERPDGTKQHHFVYALKK